MKTPYFAIALVLSFMLTGSAWSFSPRDVFVAKENGEGETRVYSVDKGQAWEIAHAVLRWQHSNPIEDHRDMNYMLTSIGISTCPCKTEVGVWIEPETEKETRVLIVTRGRSYKNDFTQMEIFPDKIKPDFHAKFQKGVDIIKSGKELPFTAP